MKVFVNKEGELALAGLFYVGELYTWILTTDEVQYATGKHPSKWGWEYLSDL